MGEVFGYELVAQALKNEGADTMFFIMGGPMLGAQDTCRKLGIRMIDVLDSVGPSGDQSPDGPGPRPDGCGTHHCSRGCQPDSSFSYRSLSGSRSAQHDASCLEMGRAGD